MSKNNINHLSWRLSESYVKSIFYRLAGWYDLSSKKTAWLAFKQAHASEAFIHKDDIGLSAGNWLDARYARRQYTQADFKVNSSGYHVLQ